MFERSVGKKPGAVHRLLAHEHRRDHGREARLREVVEREPVERHRDARGVADDVAEARARDARRALHVEAADLRVLPRLRERRAARRRDVAPRRRPRCRRRAPTSCGGFGHQRERRVARGLGRGELLLGLLERRLDGPQRLELLRCRLALELRAARGARRPRGMSARQRSSASSSASNSSAAPLRASAARQPSGSLRAAFRSITRVRV